MTARRLVHLPITALLLLSPAAAMAQPSCFDFDGGGGGSCASPRGGDLAQIQLFGFLVTNRIPGCASTTLTLLSTTPGLSFSPSSFQIGSGMTQIDTDILSPSGLPSVFPLTIQVQGCNTSCSKTFGGGVGGLNPCLGLTGSTPVCTATGAQGCTYGTTLDLRVDPVTAGVVTLSSSVGSVAPQTAPAAHGHQPLPVTLTVPCGTPSATLDLVYSLGGLGSPETLEQPITLALPACLDAVSGTKFADPNHNGQRDPGEPGLAGWRIFADLNGNGTLDAGEPSAVTDANGQYSLSVPHGGSYAVAEVRQPGWMPTAPAAGAYTVSQSTSGLDFGNWQCKLTTSNFRPLLCAGDSTTVPLLPYVPPGPVTWYATTDCATTAVPPAPPWTALGPGGPIWSTLALDQTTCYRAGIGGLSGCADPLLSSAVPVFVSPIAPAPVVTCGLPGGGSCGGAACGPIQPTLQVTGACTPQWQQLVAGTWQNVSGATAATFTPPPLAAAQCPSSGFDFRAVSSCRGCQASPLSNVADLAVFAPSQAGTLSALKGSVCPGDDDVVTLAGQCGETVQWQNDTGTGFHDIPGALGPTVWLTNRLFQTTSYRTVVSNGPCTKAVSAPVKVTLLQKPTVALGAAGPTRFCAPGSVLLSATFSPPGGSFVWFKDGVALTPPVPFSTRLVTQTGNYAVRYRTPPCGEARSSVVQVLASQPAAAILGPCGLCQPGCVTLQAVAAGGAAPYSFHWLPGNASGPQISACAPASYSVAVVDALGCKASAVQAVGLCQRLQIVAGAARNIAHGASTVLGGSPTASGGVGPYTYFWFPSAGLSDPQAPNPVARPLNSITYTVTVTDAKGCTGRASVFVHVSRLFPLSPPAPAVLRDRLTVNGVRYGHDGAAASLAASCGGGQMELPPETIGALTVSRKLFLAGDGSFVRWASVIANPGATPQPVTVAVERGSAGDGAGLVVGTASGGAAADVRDLWVSTFQPGSTPAAPHLGHVLQSAAAPIPLSAISFGGAGGASWTYRFTLQPGETTILLDFLTAQPTAASARLKAGELAAFPPNARQCLSAAELAAVGNFVPLAATQVPTLGTAGLAALLGLLALAGLLVLRYRRP